ncbi:LytR/AlgR family response regulator transcription factor [Ekhidna sp.]
MISVFVVEDEVRVMEATVAMLDQLDVVVVGTASNVEDAYNGIITNRPDVVLMDVELGKHKSFEVLERYHSIDFKIIFTTAHQKYALDAFKFSAVDFLLKPLNLNALEEGIRKASESLIKDQTLKLKTLQYNLNAGIDDQKIILKTQTKVYVIKLDEIIHCESDQSYSIFHTIDSKIIVSKTLGYYDDLLSSFGFYRVHKSHLINLKHVVQIHRSDGGEVEMSNGQRLSISQRKKEDFLQRVDTLGLQ